MSGAQTATAANKMGTHERDSDIQSLNDKFRKTGQGGITVMSMGLMELGSKAVTEIRKAIASVTSFPAEDDPDGMHDAGSLSYNGRLIYWMVEYYDKDIATESPDPSDPDVTTRLMTVLLATEC